MARAESRSGTETAHDNGRYGDWETGLDLPAIFYCEGLHDDHEGFRVLLKGEKSSDPLFRIRCEDVFAYRNLNESYRLRTFDLVKRSGLFIVEDSQWLQWFQAENYNVLRDLELTHYAIFSAEDWIDLITGSVPIVEWL